MKKTFIKRLEVRGFKSFGSKKNVIQLDKGLNVITGPNGSGKSNIFDAVRFVLGDLSARSLRADKMSEVIFDGIPGQSAASKAAYVRIRFDNGDRRMPIDRDTVTVSRMVARTGVSKYSLNGRRVSRGRLVDTLSMAELSPSGYNMIMQGTITRLADVTPEERRKVIEDLAGISEYDVKKAEARVQLNQAETNLRIAFARIGDVQARLERLEEERNECLRHNFTQREVKKLQATLLSYRITQLEREKAELNRDLKQKTSEVEYLRGEIDQLQLEREAVESKRRKFEEEFADRGGLRLIAVQNEIGDIRANIASVKVEVKLGAASLKRLKKMRGDRLKHLETLGGRIKETRQVLLNLRNEGKGLKRDLDEKASCYNAASNKLAAVKDNLEADSEKIREYEYAIDKLRRSILSLNISLRGDSVRRKILSENVQTLDERRRKFESTLKDLKQHLEELWKLRKGEQERLSKASDLAEKSLLKRMNLTTEISEAEKTLNTAREAVTEFEAKRSLAETMNSEDSALQRIEGLGGSDAIPGIIGRIENLIKVNPSFKRAIEAASAGWLTAIVVEDVETALKIVEMLKKTRVGMVKLIPLREVKGISSVFPPKIEGAIGSASSLISCDRKYEAAVNFIFGDTIVTIGEKSAFLASKAGYRAVDLKGDLYETGGGIISGYYRNPINLSSLLPSEDAVCGLSKSVKSLEKAVNKRKGDVEAITRDVAMINEECTRRSEVANILEREFKSTKLNIDRVRRNISVLNKSISGLRSKLDEEDEKQTELKLRRDNYIKSLREALSKRRDLRRQIETLNIANYEDGQKELKKEVNELSRRLEKIKSDISSLEKSLRTILKPEFENFSREVEALNKQISTLQENIISSQLNLNENLKQLYELEKSRENLSKALSSVKDRRRGFEKQLDGINEKLRNISGEYEHLTIETHRLELEIQTKKLEVSHLMEELRSLGYESPLHFDSGEVKDAKASLGLMNLELERLGSVNQLAVAQYNEQQANYKHLYLRLSQLESERKSIIDFMEDIERRKGEAFIKGFNDIDEAFTKFFSKLTGGGKGYLSLQKPKDPFSGGVDIFVKFPGKTIRLISGASGGEKSVAAVAFIFAVQALSPAPFYMFDEVGAHLDPYNSERLADLLKEQSATSQIICITLRDVIMDRADRLFGFYVQNGISRMISPKIVEAVA